MERAERTHRRGGKGRERGRKRAKEGAGNASGAKGGCTGAGLTALHRLLVP